MIKVAVVGVGGRMGSLISRLIGQATDLSLVAASEQPGHTLIGQCLDQVSVVQGDWLDLTDVDVVVDFTSPKNSLNTLRKAVQSGCSAVIGTTGFTEQELLEIDECAKKIPILLSPNMSIGVNIFFQAVQYLAKLLPDHYDVEVVELHHRHKKDAPSGTAKRIVKLLGANVPCHSMRLGEIIGEHQVHFAGNGERITVTHQAENRETFAQGALVAIRFLCAKPPGLYTMFDVLDKMV